MNKTTLYDSDYPSVRLSKTMIGGKPKTKIEEAKYDACLAL